MMETLAVLLVLFFLFAMGLQFWSSMQAGELQEMQQRFSRMDAQKVANFVAHSPLLKCTQNEVEKGTNCIDKYKLVALPQLPPAELAKVFGRVRIEYEHVYPDGARPAFDSTVPVDAVTGIAELFTTYDPLEAGKLNSKPLPIVVSVYDDYTVTYGVGILWVTIYD